MCADAKTLPRGFFERSKDVFSLKNNAEASSILKAAAALSGIPHQHAPTDTMLDTPVCV